MDEYGKKIEELVKAVDDYREGVIDLREHIAKVEGMFMVYDMLTVIQKKIGGVQ